MSGPLRRQITPALRRLRERIEEARPIVDNRERNNDEIEVLRMSLVHIKQKFNLIDDKHEQWRNYMIGLDGDARINEERVYDEYKQEDRHITDWMDDAREIVTEIEIILANESEASERSDDVSVELGNLRIRDVQRNGRPEQINLGVAAEAPPMFYPKLPWPYFYGEVLEWPVFWQAFETSVHRRQISDAQKVTYLLLSLKGRAARAVKGYQAIGENYQPIVDALKRQFGNSQVIKESLQSELINLPPANEAVASLRGCLEDIERICRQLVALGQPQGDGGFLLMAIRNKFPREIVLEVLKMEKGQGKLWGVAELRKGLDEVISLREEAMRCSKSIMTRPNNETYLNHRQSRKYSDRDRNKEFTKPRPVHRAFTVQESNKRWPNQGYKTNPKCYFCNGPHTVMKCRQVVDRIERIKILEKDNRCHQCLKKDHTTIDCKGMKCSNCEGKHHRVICPKIRNLGEWHDSDKKMVNKNYGQISNTNSATVMSTMNKISEYEVFLMSIRVEVYGGRDLTRKANVLIFFDSGSQLSFITEDLVRRLSPPKLADTELELLAIRQKSATKVKSGRYLVSLRADNGELLEVVLNRIDHLTKEIQRINVKSGQSVVVNEKPDIMIGMAEFWKLFRRASEQANGLHKVETVLGDMVCGALNKGDNGMCLQKLVAVMTEVANDAASDVDINTFWDLEAVGVKDDPNQNDDAIALEMFEKSIYRDNGRYVVGWPWKSPREELACNFALAYRRFLSLLQKLQKSPELLKWYDEHLKNQMKEGIIEISNSDHNEGYFLPHHVVVSSKKNRIVYDASAKMRGRSSLNDCLYRGQVILPLLPGLLLRFRVPKIAMWSDIQSAFWTLQLNEADRNVTKFLWLKDMQKTISPMNLLIFQFRRVPFGVISSPFLLAATVQQHLKNYGTALANEACRNIYVDNIFVGCTDAHDAVEKYKILKTIFYEAKMNLREFISNCRETNKYFLPEDKLDQLEPKVLGMKWDVIKDLILIRFPEVKNESLLSRRIVLKGLASIFDPLGWAAPCLLPAKLFLQRLWDKDRKWDDKLSNDEQKEWHEIANLWNGTIFEQERRIIFGKKQLVELHAFVDASKYAYATCIYIRCDFDGSVRTKLLYARSRLKPRNLDVTIPKMELLGVLIGSRAIKMVFEELGLNIRKKTLWCDSKPVLCWIKSKSDQPKFISNRLNEIRKNIGLECRYIPAGDNPADVASRGCTPNELKENNLWWLGPTWLSNDCKFWPSELTFIIEESEELKDLVDKTAVVMANVESRIRKEELIDFTRFNCWEKCVRVMALVLKISKVCGKGK